MFIGRPLAERGDTIVEVLIAIAVVSLILGGAYVTTNRSLLATRSAQERSIALKLAESQIERIKVKIATAPTQLFGATAPTRFCISDANVVINAVTAPANCGLDSGGAVTSTEPIFHLSVERVGSQFNLTETWFDVSGRTTDQLQMKYRAYQ